MPHIHTEEGQYDFTISAFIARRFTDEWKVLLHMHRKLGKLLPVGGHIELNETPWEGLRHELKEESGYSREELKVLQPRERIVPTEYRRVVVQPIPIHINSHEIDSATHHSHVDYGYVLVATEDPSGTPDDGESLDLRWLTREEIQELSEDSIWSNTRINALSVFDMFLGTWEEVPAIDFLEG